jgi:hypothetical protein
MAVAGPPVAARVVGVVAVVAVLVALGVSGGIRTHQLAVPVGVPAPVVVAPVAMAMVVVCCCVSSGCGICCRGTLLHSHQGQQGHSQEDGGGLGGHGVEAENVWGLNSRRACRVGKVKGEVGTKGRAE